MEPILKVSGLTKTFSRQGQADFTAVKNISFDLFPDECLAIIGESGSGKTTAVNMIARLVDVTSGSIFLDGEDITNLKGKPLREVYKTMQMVFQTPADSFDPRRTLGDGIGESLRNAGLSQKETRERVESLLKNCGLPPEYADRYPHQVSGGQCQPVRPDPRRRAALPGAGRTGAGQHSDTRPQGGYLRRLSVDGFMPV